MSEIRAALTEWAEQTGHELIFFDGLDEAIVGIVERPTMGPVVAYDRQRCVEIFAREFSDDGEPDWEAAE